MQEEHSDIYFLEKAPVSKAITHLSVPMILGLSATVFYNVADAYFIGMLESTPMLPAVTFALPVMILLMAFGSLFGVGAGTYISRMLGRKRGDRAKSAASFAFYGSLACGLLCALGIIPFMDTFVGFLGAEGDAVAPTREYAWVLLLGAPIIMCNFALEQIVRAEGAARVSMTGIFIAAAGNVVLDPLFIFYFKLNIIGAALATVLANALAVLYFVYFLQRKSPCLRACLGKFSYIPSMIKSTFSIGVSELMMSGFLIVSTLLLNNYAITHGDSVVAGFGIAFRVTQIPELFTMGLFLGVIPLLAYSFSSGERVRFGETIRKTSLYMGVLVLLFSVIVFLFREKVVGLFSKDPEVLAVGAHIMVAMLVSALLSGFTGLFSSIFQATGKAGQAILMSVLRGGLFIPVLMLGHKFFGLYGIIWALTLTEVICFVCGGCLLLYFRGPLKSGSAAKEMKNGALQLS